MMRLACWALLVAVAVGAGAGLPPATGAAATEPAFGVHWNPKKEGRVLLGELVRIGGRITVLRAQWPAVQPAPDRWDFSQEDAWVKEASTAGMEVVFKILTCSGWFSANADAGRTPGTGKQGKAGAKGTGRADGTARRTCTSSMPRSMDEYARYVRTVVQRYKGQIRYFAIQNEVNAPNQWPNSLQAYHQLLRAAYRAVKDTNSQAIVVDDGMGSLAYGYVIAKDLKERTGDARQAAEFFNTYYAGRQGSIPSASAENFTSVVLNNRLANRYQEFLLEHFKETSYDAYQLHFYDDWRVTERVIGWIQEQMRRNNNVKPILGWEMGYKWSGQKPYDADEHAYGIVKKYVTAAGLGVRHLIYLPAVQDTDPEEEDARVPSRPLYTCTPNCVQLKPGKAFEVLARTLTGATAPQRLPMGGGITAWQFSQGNRKVIVAWSDAAATVDMSRWASVIRAVDVYGQPVDASTPQRVPVSPRPVYIDSR